MSTIKEGLLWKRPRGHTIKGRMQQHKWQLRWFQFEDGNLQYFRQSRRTNTVRKSRNPNMELRGTVLIRDGITVERIEDEKPFAFVVHNVINSENDQQESIYLACSDESEMTEWMRVLTRPQAPVTNPIVRLKDEGKAIVIRKPTSRKVAGITELYDVQERLGQGGFAVVKRGVDKQDGQEYALKLIQNSVFNKNKERVMAECKVLASLDHPGVVKLKEVVPTNKYFVIVMELLRGKELFDRIVERKKYGEQDAKIISAHILDAIRYMHKNDIVHRDIKPENIIFDKPGDDAQLKLTDFGFAEIFDKDVKLQDACGTPEYVAPEILEEKEYDSAVDMWSVGVVIYILLCGFPPFHGETEKIMFERICGAKYKFLRPYWDVVSDQAKDLITHLLEKDPRKRFTAQEALEHSWFSDIVGDPHDEVLRIDDSVLAADEDEDLPGNNGLGSALDLLRGFNAFRKFKRGVLVVIAVNRMRVSASIVSSVPTQLVED